MIGTLRISCLRKRKKSELAGVLSLGPQRIISGLKTNANLSPSSSATKKKNKKKTKKKAEEEEFAIGF